MQQMELREALEEAKDASAWITCVAPASKKTLEKDRGAIDARKDYPGAAELVRKLCSSSTSSG